MCADKSIIENETSYSVKNKVKYIFDDVYIILSEMDFLTCFLSSKLPMVVNYSLYLTSLIRVYINQTRI